MKPRSLVVLAVVVLALAIAVVVDRPSKPGDPGEARRLLPGFQPVIAQRITLERPGQPPLVLAREGDGLVIVAPARLPTDDEAVRDLLGALEYLAWRREMTSGGAGLDPPRVRVLVEWQGGRGELAIGAADRALGRTWLRRGDDLFLVDDYAARALDRGVDELRRRELFASVSGELGVGRVRVVGDCLRAGDHPACARPDPHQVAELRQRLEDLRVTRFLASAPAAEGITIAAGGAHVTLAGECPGSPGERVVVGPGVAGCIDGEVAASLEAIDRQPQTLLDRSLLGVTSARVTRVSVGPLLLARQATGWTLGSGERADTDAVLAWLEELAAYRAGEARTAPVLAAPPAGALVLTVAAEESEPVVAWIIPGLRAGDPLVMRRPGDGVSLLFHADLLGLLLRAPVTFADRTVLSFDPWALAAVVVAEGGVVERAERGVTQERWRLTTPLILAADADVVADVRETASELRAAQVVAERAAPEHGLSPPRRTLSFVLEPAEEPAPAVELGRVVDDGCFARRRGAARVFKLAAAPCRALAAHLASRVIYGVDLGEVLAVAVGAERWSHQGPSWYDASGKRAAGADAVRLAALVRHLAASPAVAGYGPMPPGALRIVIGTTRGDVVLRAAGGLVGVEGRPVRYKVAPEVCERWPVVCLGR